MKKWPWKADKPPNGGGVVATSVINRSQLRTVFDHLDAILTRAEEKLEGDERGKSAP